MIASLNLRTLFSTLHLFRIPLWTALFSLGPLTSGCVASMNCSPGIQESVEPTPIIMDNTIVFWAISQEDYDALLAKDPKYADWIEGLTEYYMHSAHLASELKSRGFTVLFGSWSYVDVQIAEGKTNRIRFNPMDFKAILMKAKGKEPKMVINFSGEYPDMAKIVSEYFKIDLSR